MNHSSQLSVANAALTELAKMHDQFITHIRSLATHTMDGGSIQVDGSNIKMTCLGVTLTGKHRPIAVDGFLTTLEYPFFATHMGNEILVWRFYLDGKHTIYEDLAKVSAICSTHNQHFAAHLVEALTPKLLASPLFAAL